MITLSNTLQSQEIQPKGNKLFRFLKSLFEVEEEKQSPVIMYLILFNAFILFLHFFLALPPFIGYSTH